MSLGVGEIVSGLYQERKSRNPRYTMRAMARDLGVSPAFLSLLIRGQRKLSVNKALLIANRLKMEQRERNEFLKSVALSTISQNLREFVGHLLMATSDDEKSDSQYFIPELDRVAFLTHWYHVPILELMTCKGAKSEIGWIAKRLRLTNEEAQDAIDRLERMGLLQRSDGKWRKTYLQLLVPTTHSERAIREFHKQMMTRAAETLDRDTSAIAFEARKIISSTVAVNSENIQKAKLIIERFCFEINELARSGDCSEVYQFNLQFFPLTTQGDEKCV